ncbi:hypothetical protein [Streptomyces sp. NPDC048002]|uniref:hypothetical protein n=1 Tax=Streptomyces sp. NPDC048002 TaxID=3154344 RepID=UPI0033CF7526
MGVFEGGEGVGDGVEGAGDAPQVVLAVEVDALAGVAVGADGHGGPVVVGVGVDDQVAVADVVVELLGLVGDVAYLAAREPGHGVLGPGPLLVDGLPQRGCDLGADALIGEFLIGLIGPVGLFMVDAGQDHGVFVEGLEAPAGQESVRGVRQGAGEVSDDGTGVGGVGVEADEDVGGHGGAGSIRSGPSSGVGRGG